MTTPEFNPRRHPQQGDPAPVPAGTPVRPGETEPDLVNSPPHYCSHPSGVECIVIVEQMNFCLGNAVKYLWRAGLKPGTDALVDLDKARWYIEREITRRQKT